MRTYPAPPVREITLTSDEVSVIGTASGNPDFYEVIITYVPRKRILCTKSLKEWFGDRRNELYSAERFACVIADAVRESVQPRVVNVTVVQKPRGGISIRAHARR